MHNVINDNCKKIRREYQLFDSTSEEGFKGRSYYKNNVGIKSSAQNDRCLPRHKLNNGNATDTAAAMMT